MEQSKPDSAHGGLPPAGSPESVNLHISPVLATNLLEIACRPFSVVKGSAARKETNLTGAFGRLLARCTAFATETSRNFGVNSRMSLQLSLEGAAH